LLLAAALGAVVSPAGAQRVELVTGHGDEPFADPGLPAGGMAAAIVRAAYATVPTKLDKIAFSDWKRGYKAVQRGDYAATFPYVKTPERREEMYFSDPIYVTKSYPALNARTSLRIDSMNELVGLTFCAPDDDGVPRAIKKLERQGKVFGARPAELIDCARMLRRQRVDFVPTLKPVFRRTAEDAFGGTSAFRFGDLVIRRVSRHVIFPKGRDGAKAAVETFNAGLARVKESGRWTEIVERYVN
jgi:polar amino acid transport system substrate-binding protein